MHDDDQHRELAQQLVAAEIEDVLTINSSSEPPAEQYARIAKTIARQDRTGNVLVEATALAGEAVIRLAHARGEDPRATLHWIFTTEWTTAGPRYGFRERSVNVAGVVVTRRPGWPLDGFGSCLGAKPRLALPGMA